MILRRFPPWLAPALVVALLAGLVAWQHGRQQQATPPVAVACADIRAGCGVELAGRPVTIGATGELKVLSPFDLWAKAPGAEQVRARFTMEGMDMGFNLYTLKPDRDGVFHARVTLPVCVTGRRDWVVTVSVDGRELAVPFVTDL